MKNRMMQIVVALGLMALTAVTQASVLPEFMNARQLVVWRAQHSAPSVTVAQAPDEQPVFFTGKPYDATSGTYLFMFRSYSPTLARWTSADPSGFPNGANNHIYCENNVVRGLDPLGLNVFFCQANGVGGHAWVDIGGNTPNAGGSSSYGFYPNGPLSGKPGVVESPDGYQQTPTSTYTYTEVQTTPAQEAALTQWIYDNYNVGFDNSSGITNPNYTLVIYDCRTFRNKVRKQLQLIINKNKSKE